MSPRLRGESLSFRSIVILLLYGGSLLLVHLGDTRVLTRHEVLAAQPAREMLEYPHSTRWILPTLAGTYRTAKPPGGMWLIASSMAVFHSQAEWVARFPSAMSGLAIAVMIAWLTARWLGERIGIVAGLLQLTFVYTLMQARLAEADMALAAMVCAAMCALAAGAIELPDRPAGGRWLSWVFYLALAATFLLKGAVGPLFIFLSVGCFLAVRRDRRIGRFLLNPGAMLLCAALVVSWPLAAYRIYPGITHDWWSEQVGTPTGQMGVQNLFFYFYMVPFVLLPWLPLVALGAWEGWKRGEPKSAMAQFLACWFIPGFIALSLMAQKHAHYPIPILPPLTTVGAVGLIAWLNRPQITQRGQHRIAAGVFLIGCAMGIFQVQALHGTAAAMKGVANGLLLVLALGGMATIYAEHRRWMNVQLIAIFATAWLIAVGVQTFAMPLQDDYKPQADFGRQASNLAPAGKTIYLLGRREEEHEAQYAYYLRFPMQRYDAFDDFVAFLKTQSKEPVYVIAPRVMEVDLSRSGQIKSLARCSGLRLKETEDDRVGLYEITPSAIRNAPSP